MIMNALVYVHKIHTLGHLLGGKCQHKIKKNTKKNYLGFLIPKSLKSFLGSFHQALKHSKFSTYACPASSTKKCVNFLFVLNFPKMARVPHTTLKVFTLSWISLTSVVEYFFTWSDMLFDWYQERLTIERKKSIGCGSTRSGTSCFFTFWFHEM